MTSRRAGISLSIVDGENITRRVESRLVRLTLSEKRESAADELTFTLENTKRDLPLPPTGRKLALQMGWTRNPGGAVGLVNKGQFIVDEVALEGPPDVIIVRARSADLTGPLRQLRTLTWKDTRLGAILETIAGRYGRSARIESGLASQKIETIEQEGKSDMAFLRDLGRRYDAIATWKADQLLFLPIGASASAGGTPLPSQTLRPIDGGSWSAREASRDRYDGAQAQWHDQAAGHRRTVKIGGRNNPRKLKRVYASEAEARQAAQAAFSRDSRAPWSFQLDLAIADLALQPDTPVSLQGWTARTDALNWIVKAVETVYDDQGMRQRVEFESV